MIDGRILTSRLVRLACQRHLHDLVRGHERGLTWSPDHVAHAIEFFRDFLILPDGHHAGEPFVLAPPWEFVVGSLYGWFNAEGYRRFRNAYVEAGKGSAKTPVGCGMLIYAIVAEGTIGTQCYVAAGSREQADIPFRDCKNILGPALLERLEILEHNIAMPAMKSFIRPISSEGRTLDGKRVHFALLDELHEHRDHVVVNKMRAGTKNNRNSLILEITNSGVDRLSVCWDHREKSRRVLEGSIIDDEWFAYVCGLDPCESCRLEGKLMPDEECPACDDWRDAATWIKANPLLGISLPVSYLRTEVKNAIDISSSQDMVKRLNFCIWTSSHMTWIPPDRWRQCDRRVPDDDLVGAECYAGLDLGQTDDFSALALVFRLADGRLATRMRYWIPRRTLTLHPQRPYSIWQREADLIVDEDEVVSEDRIKTEIAAACHRYGVRELAYDRRFAEGIRQYLEGEGIACIDTPQGFQLNEAIRRIEELVRDGKLCHGGDPVLAWMVSNVVLRRGTRGEVRLDKDKSSDKIDGVAALCSALSRVVVSPGVSVYESRGVLVL